MKLFSNNIVPYTSTEGDKIYPIVVDIKKGIKSGEAISFVTADNQVGVITVDFMDGNSSYSIEGCMVTSTIRRPDGTVLEIPCDIISQSTIEIPLGINGTYQEGVHTFDLKIVRGNGKVIGVPTMSYSVSGSLSSDGVVEGDDRLPVLTMVLDNAQDKLTRLDKAIAGATNDLEVKEARDGEVTLNARLERDLEKGKIHFVECSGEYISTESQEGYLENIEIYGNTWQDANNLADIRSVGTKVEGQELYEIPVLSANENLFNGNLPYIGALTSTGKLNTSDSYASMSVSDFIKVSPDSTYYWKNFDDIKLYRICGYSDKNEESFVQIISNSDRNTEALINTGGNTKYIRIGCQTTGTTRGVLNVGKNPIDYVKKEEHKLTILSPTPLEKVGDIADRIICKDGVWGVEKNTQSIKLNASSSEAWSLLNEGNNTYGFRIQVDNIKSQYSNPSIINSMFVSDCEANWNKDEELCFSTSTTIGVRVSKSKVGSYSLSKFKEWLSFNPITIKYKLKESQFIPLPHDQQVKLRTFADRTNIHFETEIEPTIKAQVPKSLGATVNTHTSQIDNLNKELDRVKKLEESTVSTVTSDKAFTTVAETTQGYFEDVKIEGKTLVNLAIQPTNNGHINTKYASISKAMYIKPSTEYTYIIRNNGSEMVKLYLNSSYCFTWTSVDVEANSTVIGKAESLPTINGDIWLSLRETETVKQNLQTVLLEGDHTDEDLSFFEGLKSVGQDTDGIEIVSKNKNLFDGTWIDGTIDTTTGEDNYNTTECKTDYICIGNCARLYKKEFTDTNLPYTHYKTRFFDKNKKYIGSTDTWGNSSEYYDVPTGAVYIRLIPYETNREVMSNVRLIVSKSEITDYIEPKMNKNQILYYNPTTQAWEKPILREWDSIEKHSDGKYYYHKRSNEIILNGSEGWYSVATLENVLGFGVGIDLHGVTDLSKVISDRFSFVGDDNLGQIRLGNSGKSIFIYIHNTKLSTQDVAGFKKWLQSNPTTVVYKLAQEEVYECTNLDLITYPNETNLIVNSGVIQPRITLKVLSNVSNVVKLLQEKVSVLENKFIEGLKQVLSGNMMALAQLLYPEDFEH